MKPKSYLIPTVIEKKEGSEHAYDLYSRLLEDRIIFLGEEVNSHTANLVVAELLYLASLDPKKPIKLYINSPGGSVYDGLAIIDTMNYISCPVETIGVGLQASMGAMLLSSGTKGHRFCLENARVMIHQPSSGTEGKITDQSQSGWQYNAFQSMTISESMICQPFHSRRQNDIRERGAGSKNYSCATHFPDAFRQDYGLEAGTSVQVCCLQGSKIL